MQFLGLIFRYGALWMLGLTAGGVLMGHYLLSESLFGIAFIVIVIGGLSKLFQMMFGAVFPKFLDTKQKQQLGDLAVLLIGVLCGFGMGA